MSSVNDGGPAFPVSHWDSAIPQGMTLRQYYAGQALTALLSKCEPFALAEIIAEDAVKFADALIAELNKARETKP